MKKLTLFIVLAASLGCGLQAQDTLWQKTAPQSNYFYNNWIDTTERYVADDAKPVFSHTIASQFIAKDEVLEVYGIAAMMLNVEALYFVPSHNYPDFQSYLDAKYPEDPSFDNCEESLILFQYHGSPSPIMLQMGDSLPIHILHTPVSYWMKTNTTSFYWDTVPKPVYERYFSTPQTVHDTFYVGFTCSEGGFSEIDSIWYDIRPDISCLCFMNAPPNTGHADEVAAYKQLEIYASHEWIFLHNQLHCSYFIFPILTPPDTTVNPIIPEPCDTVTTGYLVLHPGNTLVIAPGDTLVIGGDTLVNTGDTLVVTLGDTLVLGGSTFVVNAGDTLFVTPGDTLFVNPDGTVTVNPGGTFVVGSGTPGDDPGVGLRQTDMLYRYTSVMPNPATQRATVTSSFGLERIEVYDSQGRQTLSLPATGYRATLDLSAWPRGTYLLRIHTPLGTTTKKLIVQ